MNIPTVSIGLPVYNGENFLKEAVDSILSQTFTDFELIISDNASTDNTMDICKVLANKDRRIRYYRNGKNMGAAWNFNQVFHLARGKFFQWACHDDVWTPTLLASYVEALDKMSDIVLCYSRTTYIDENGKPIRNLIGRPNFYDTSPSRRFRMFLKYHIHPNECNPVLGLFRTSVLKKTTLTGNFPASDMVLLGEVALHGAFYEIPECLFLRRDHPGISTRAHPKFEDRAVFLDPNQKGKIQMPRWRWFIEWMKSILRAPIGASERIRCVLEVCKWAKRNKANLEKELKYCVKKFIYPDAYAGKW